MTLGTTMMKRIFNGKALAATALLLPMLALPFNAHADGPDVAPAPIEQAAAETDTGADDTTSPSYFEADADGVLWFREGGDGKGPYSMAGSLSAEMKGIVILIATKPSVQEKALAHGRRLQDWLQRHPRGPGKEKVTVAIVVRDNDVGGTFYYYNTLGMPYWNNDMSQNEAEGRFGPKSAAAVLPKVIISFLAAMERKATEQASAQDMPRNMVATMPAPQ